MSLVLLDRAYEITTSTGSGPFVLGGAVTEYQAIGNIGDGNATYMTIKDQSGSNWMVFAGTYTLSSNSVSVDSIFSSSASGAAVTFGAGIKDIYIDVSAARIGTTQVGDVKIASETPVGPGTWLETGKYYSKTAYPELAAKIGDIADFGTPITVPQAQIPQPFAANSNTYSPYITATNGSITIAVGQSGAIRKTTDGINWIGVPSTTTQTLNEVRYLNGNFVAVGASGTIVSSADGTTWTTRASALTASLTSVAYGNSKYVAVDNSGTIQYSSDLITWTLATGTGSLAFYRVIYANSLFVAVGNSGSLYTSTDGITWASRSAGASTFYDVTYANSVFVSVGGTNTCYSSVDGNTWTSRTITGSYNQIIYANSLFVTVGSLGVISTSSDGITWVSKTSGTTTSLFSLIWDGTNFVAVGQSGVYVVSNDGTSWAPNTDVSNSNFTAVALINNTTIAFGQFSCVILAGGVRTEVLQNGTWRYSITATSATNPRAIAYNGTNLYVAVGQSGAILSSSDGQSWVGRYSGITANLDKVQWVNGNFIAMGPTGGGANISLLSSTDGITWTGRMSGTGIFNAATYGASKYVAVGASGIVYSSPDLITWTSRSAGAQTFNDVIYANSVFVAVGAAGACYSSTDGATWVSRSAGSAAFLRVIYANSLFVAIGATGVIYTSSDGVTWASRTSKVSGQLNDVIWNGSLFCAVGAAGIITTSTDGITWVARTPGDLTAALNSISWSGARFVVTNTTNGVAWTSTDGITWSRTSTVYQGTSLYSCYLGGKFLAIGSGFVQTSTDGMKWTNCDHVQYVPTAINKIYKLGDRYYALTNKGIFQSTDGSTFTLAGRTLPSGAVLSMAYNGSIWVAMSSATQGQPQAIYTSADGSIWVKTSDIGTLTTSSSLPAAVDLVYANGNFIVGQSISSQNTCPIYTSSDGVNWIARQTPYASVPNGSISSDETTAVYSSTSNGSFKSIDGGVTWTQINTLSATPVIYSNGVWVFNGANDYVVSSDLSTYYSTGIVTTNQIPSSIYVSGDIIIGVVAYNKVYINKSASGYVALPQLGATAVTSYASSYKAAPTRNSTALIGIGISNATFPNLILETPLYSYDTATTFWVPPSNAGVGQKVFIYAGA